MTKTVIRNICVLLAGIAVAAGAGAQQLEVDDEIRATVTDDDERANENDDFASDESSVETDFGATDPDAVGDEPETVGVPDIDADFGATDAPTDDADPEAVEARERDELQRSFELYVSSIRNEMYDEADTLAKRIIELSIKLYGVNSLDSARALTNLGTVQYHNKDFASAQLNYQAAIEIIERIEDRLHADLVNPLKGLGAAQLSAGRPDLAEDSFTRAVHITHVNEGPHNLMQVDVLDALTETYLAAGDVDEALNVQENVYNLQTRNVDPDSEDILPALERQANWMHRVQHYNAERNAYRRIIRVLESTRGRDDIALIPPLTGLGRSYLFVEPYDPEIQSYTPASGGEVYLKRALRIAEESPQADWQQLRSSMLALGDFYTLSGRESRAKKAYSEVWNYLSAEEERIPSRIENLESPVILQDISPTKYYHSTRQNFGAITPDNFERGTVVVGFNIDKSGDSTNIELVEARPPGLVDMENEVLRKVRDLIYRPRFKDGEAIEVDGVTYTHEFFYRLSDLAESEAEDEDAESPAPDQ
jgi:tetratricopeptide (TPR) repeat protein